jgi:hypothetical protein
VIWWIVSDGYTVKTAGQVHRDHWSHTAIITYEKVEEHLRKVYRENNWSVSERCWLNNTYLDNNTYLHSEYTVDHDGWASELRR